MLDKLQAQALEAWTSLSSWASSPKFYAQIAAIVIAILLARFIASTTIHRIAALAREPEPGPLFGLRRTLYQFRTLLYPLLVVLLLGVAAEVTKTTVDQSWFVRLAQSLAVVFLLYRLVEQVAAGSWIASLFKWIGIPVATLHIFGWLDEVTQYLDGISLEVGNIRLSAYALARTLIFGSVLFWLGRLSNDAGKQVIRNQSALDAGTREVFAKLFEIGLYIVIFLLILQVMGINLTALAVFGGALGVGLGFGLQQIAANFISGIIILLDRSITLGDYIELEDGRTGSLTELNMRYAVLKTFDGKEIMVPNEKFITTSFVNWTHANSKQRYSLNFSVAYDTDLDHLIKIVREVVASHPQVLSGPNIPVEERPDAEISAFGDSGIEILVEFWMEGIDDGKNRVGADLLHMIWRALREHGIEIPFPQREVKILNPDAIAGVERTC